METSRLNEVKGRGERAALRGGRFMMSASASSYAMLIAGTISVPKSIAKIKTVERGMGVRKTIQQRNGEISGMLEVSV